MRKYEKEFPTDRRDRRAKKQTLRTKDFLLVTNGQTRIDRLYPVPVEGPEPVVKMGHLRFPADLIAALGYSPDDCYDVNVTLCGSIRILSFVRYSTVTNLPMEYIYRVSYR